MPIRILIRTTVVPIRGVIGTTVVRIRILIGTTVVQIASAICDTVMKIFPMICLSVDVNVCMLHRSQFFKACFTLAAAVHLSPIANFCVSRGSLKCAQHHMTGHRRGCSRRCSVRPLHTNGQGWENAGIYE